MSTAAIERIPLLHTSVARTISDTDVRAIWLAPGQQTGRHLHPCTVLGYIVEGTARLRVEGEEAQILPAGSAFHEPDGATIAEFSNASTTERLGFVAFYLLDGKQELITMLDNR